MYTLSEDANTRRGNTNGGGVNFSQRIMFCDTGHITAQCLICRQ